MATCCGVIDKSMQESRIKSLFFYVLYFGLLFTVSVVLVIGWIFVRNLKWISTVFKSYLLCFLKESLNLSIFPASVKCKVAGSLYRVSPRLSGLVFKRFNYITVGIILIAGLFLVVFMPLAILF